jgi:bifunctional non-homologous end joining protein LigD
VSPGVRAQRGRKTSRPNEFRSTLEQLERIERTAGNGAVRIGRASLDVSNLAKVYFGKDGVTKGALMRYYAAVAPVILPLMRDRPLVLKRYPNGIHAPSFFQQNAGEQVPDGVRVESVEVEGTERADRIVGGDLLTMLYTVQLGSIEMHPWQSRLPAIDHADYSTIDLDPGEGVPFSRVVELAGLLQDVLKATGLHAALKTSGSRGLHIVMPLPPRTPYARSVALAEVIATRVSNTAPRLATLERRIQKRPKGTIYVDALQNARGKSVVCAYSVRARDGATVSAPLKWQELKPTLRLGAFTIETMPKRLAKVGDLWKEAFEERNTARAIERALKT